MAVNQAVLKYEKRFKFYDQQYSTETKHEYFNRLLMQNIIEVNLNAPSELRDSFVLWLVVIAFFLIVGYILAMVF